MKSVIMILPMLFFNIKKELFELHYKLIRNEKNLDKNRYINDFHQLPLNLVYSRLMIQKIKSTMNTRHSEELKLTRPIAPWMNDPKITSLHKSMENNIN